MKSIIIIFIFTLTIFASANTVKGVQINYSNLSKLFPIPRIIGGLPAREGQFPWQVILKRYALDKIWCGGSIISESLILTAAHCVDNFNSMIVVYGTINLSDTKKMIKSNMLIKHPQYNPDNYNNDIALIKLPQKLEFNDKVNKITLVPKSQAGNSFTGQTALVTGFGFTSDEIPDFSRVLLFTQMDVISNKKCEDIYGDDVIISSTLCAKGENNAIKNICGGDSGGAMVLEQNNIFIQIGINSFVTDKGCTEGIPSGFARVGSFLDFIDQYLKSDL